MYFSAHIAVSIVVAISLLALSQASVRIMSYNIRSGSDAWDTYNLTQTAAAINALKPDLVGLQEVDQNTQRHPGDNQPLLLSNLTGMAVRFGRMRDFMNGGYGVAVLSRFPILETREFHYGIPGQYPTDPLQCAVPANNDYCQGVVAIRVQPPKFPMPFWFATTHLQVADSDLNETLQLTKILQSLGGVVVMTGDFNSPPSTDAIKHMQSLYVDTYATFASPNGGYTYNSTLPSERIDYHFFTPVYQGQKTFSVANVQVPAITASDHRPVIGDYTSLIKKLDN